MELEDRVTTLEHEFKILKNEIQQTLLDLREFLLTAAYPELSGEDTAEEQERLGRNTGVLSTREAGTVSRFESIPSTEEKGRTNGKAHQKAPPKGAGPAPEGRREPSLTALMAWAGESVQRIGKARTQQALEAWTQRGHLSKETKDLLVQFIAMSEDEEPTEKVRMQDILHVLMALGELFGEDMKLTDALSHMNM